MRVLFRSPAQPLNRRLRRLARAPGGPGRVERRSSEGTVDRLMDRADLLQILIGEDRLRYFQPLERAGMVAEQVRTWADHRYERHHHRFADRIDRRVGELREVLLEIIVEQLGALGEDRDRYIVAHRSDGISAIRMEVPTSE